MHFFRNLFGRATPSEPAKPVTPPLLFEPSVLRQILPNCKEPVAWTEAMSAILPRHGITSRAALASFIGQCAVESGEFNTLEENLNYSAERMMAIWPSRFPTLATTRGLDRNPRALANRVYSNRLGNGSESSNDGWNFRGRGLIMVTGRSNYTACSRFMFNDDRLTTQPELIIATNNNAIESACWFWVTNNLNQHVHDVERTTRIVNGGIHGLRERRLYYNRALQFLP